MRKIQMKLRSEQLHQTEFSVNLINGFTLKKATIQIFFSKEDKKKESALSFLEHI